MLSVPLTAEIQQRLGELAKSRGQSEAEFARELIEASIENLDDIEMATIRLEFATARFEQRPSAKSPWPGRLSTTAGPSKI